MTTNVMQVLTRNWYYVHIDWIMQAQINLIEENG